MGDRQGSWSLEEIYPSFESEEFKEAVSYVVSKTSEIRLFAEEGLNGAQNAAMVIKKYIALTTDFYRKVMRICDFCELTLSTDADNQLALNNLEKIESALTEMAIPETKFSLFLKALSVEQLDDFGKLDETLKEHSFFLGETKRNSEYVLPEAVEEVVAKLENTGSSAWIKFQDNVMANLAADITIEGVKKRLPFSEIRSLAHDKCAETRKKAYEAELEACKSVAKSCAAALNAIKGEVLTVSGLRGYESPLQMTAIRSRLDMETLDALISSMKANLGIFIPYFDKKAALLGRKKLPFYDLFAPVGGADFNFTFDEAVDYVCENFRKFSPELSDYARRAADSHWIDVYPKEGKRGGAFCQNLHYLKQSRFLMNFTGSFNDVLTLAHELGHGYHGHCLSEETFLNSDYPMPIAETASTLCETIVVNAALGSSAPGEALSIIENGISGASQVTVDILSRFIFESKLFEMRTNGSLPVEELCRIMREAQLETYGEGLDSETLHEYMWVVKPHYYSAGTNFYNFPYAFGLLFSNGLYSIFEKEGAGFAETYRLMLSKTGKMNLKDVASVAGIDISEKSFWDSAFDRIKKDVDMFVRG